MMMNGTRYRTALPRFPYDIMGIANSRYTATTCGVYQGRGSLIIRNKQTSLFNVSKLEVHRNVPAKTGGKYKLTHYSYKQRLVKLVNQKNNNLSWKLIYKLLTSRSRPRLPRKARTGRTFTSTVNQTNLRKAVREMYRRKHGQSKLSINKIAKKYNITKPTLYRGYKNRYK